MTTGHGIRPASGFRTPGACANQSVTFRKLLEYSHAGVIQL
jgi:hypothetical protein